jgi:hypothetical protein
MAAAEEAQMTSHVGRLYALGAALVAFFVSWAMVAAHPWSTTKAARDPRLTALAQREQQLRQESRLVQKIVDRRFSDYRRRLAAYKTALAKRQAQAAAQLASARLSAAGTAAAPSAASTPTAPFAPAPSTVRVVTLPPLVVTRTS